MNETRSPAPNDSSADCRKLVARQIVGDHVAELPAFRRRVFEVAHIEVNPAAVQEKTPIPGRLFVVAVVQVERAGAHLAEEVIFHPHRPGIAIRLRGFRTR